MSHATRPNISPVFRYYDARAAIDWLVRALGFETQVQYANEDGSIGHAELRFGSSVIGISSVTPTTADNPWSSVRQGIYVCVSDVDAHHDRAKAAGATIVTPLRNLDYGSREYSARDVEGHLWGFGTYDMGAQPGEQRLFIGLHYRNGRAAIDWLNRAFGFKTTFEVPGPEGIVAHAELRLGDLIMLGSGPREKGLWGEHVQSQYGWVADPDAHYERAKSAGATIAQEPADTPYGARGYYARDPEGFRWGFSTYKPAPAAAQE